MLQGPAALAFRTIISLAASPSDKPRCLPDGCKRLMEGGELWVAAGRGRDGGVCGNNIYKDVSVSGGLD